MSHNDRALMRKRKASIFLLSLSIEGLAWIALFFLIVLNGSCTKRPVTVPQPVPQPPPAENRTIQVDLRNAEIPFWGRIETIDFDKDNFPELIFEIMPVGDPILQRDRWLWHVKTTRFTALPINPNIEQVPALSRGDIISLSDFDGYEWYHGNAITLFEKIMDTHGNTWWEGNWKQASHKFLPFKVIRADGYYAGWVEISADQDAQKGYLHKAGISNVPNKPVMAGL